MKFLGCILVFVGCTLMGYMKANSYKSRVIELENIIELIKLIEIEITYKKETLKKAFKSVARTKVCWFSNVLSECEKQLDLEKSFDNAWENSINVNDNYPITQSDLTILYDLASVLGKSDAIGQSKVIEPVVFRLKKNLEHAKANYASQGKMYRGLGIACGTTLVILLL